MRWRCRKIHDCRRHEVTKIVAQCDTNGETFRASGGAAFKLFVASSPTTAARNAPPTTTPPTKTSALCRLHAQVRTLSNAHLRPYSITFPPGRQCPLNSRPVACIFTLQSRAAASTQCRNRPLGCLLNQSFRQHPSPRLTCHLPLYLHSVFHGTPPYTVLQKHGILVVDMYSHQPRTV